MSTPRRKPYTEAQLAIDLAVQVNRLAERNKLLELAFDAAKRMAANPKSAHAVYDFTHAATQLEGAPRTKVAAR
jgi:hypothetical protein